MVKFPRNDRRNYPIVREVLQDFSKVAIPTIENRFGENKSSLIKVSQKADQGIKKSLKDKKALKNQER
jgi:hypothetical protein